MAPSRELVVVRGRGSDRDATRARVLDAAERLFATRGYLAVTVEDIALRAGFSRGAVYSNFAGKDDVFLAVAERRQDRLRDSVDAAFGQGATDEQRLESLARWFGRTVEMERDWATAEVEFFVSTASRPDVAERARRLQHDAGQDLGELLVAQCHALGVDPPMPAEQLATVVASLARGLLLEWMVDVSVDVGRIFADTIVLLLSGTTPDRASAVTPSGREPEEER